VKKKPPGIGNRWDQTKRPGRAQQAPLTPEYQAIFEASLADQAAGGQGDDVRIRCVSPGMPRMMTAVASVRIRWSRPTSPTSILKTTSPAAIYTDGRNFFKDEEPTWPGLLDRQVA